MAYVRTVRTGSGARAVQIVHGSRKGSRTIEHIGSAHDDGELEALKAAARQRLSAGQLALDLGADVAAAATGAALAASGPLPITATHCAHLWQGLLRAYCALGFDDVTEGDSVFRDLVLARIIEPTSKLDSIRVLEEVGVLAPSYRTIMRYLPRYATPAWRARLSRACAAHAALGPASLVLYDVSTLYFEIDKGDGFREPGFSKERRLEPQITIGLLTDATGFPLALDAFEGNRAETKTMLPVLRAFMTAHQLTDVTVVADAGMISEANKTAIEAEGLSFIIGGRIPQIPYHVGLWRREHPDTDIGDGHVFVEPKPKNELNKQLRDHVTYYVYSADRAKRTLHGIDEQIAKAERAVAGKEPVKRNRFIRLEKTVKSVNRELEAKARGLAGIKAYVTNMVDPTPEFVTGAYHRLYNVEKSFRMSKHDLAARPIYHHKRESIEAHLSIVMVALALSRHIETTTDWSIAKFVKTARRYRTIDITIAGQTITAADPLPDDLQAALAAI